ncbi:MAG: hypothetical protein MUP81_01500 [Dehalococcoidia bacterium]|nr:hypothetical protein [Dehalococcoidia bacterium]
MSELHEFRPRRNDHRPNREDPRRVWGTNMTKTIKAWAVFGPRDKFIAARKTKWEAYRYLSSGQLWREQRAVAIRQGYRIRRITITVED